jgi:hypothetical protein
MAKHRNSLVILTACILCLGMCSLVLTAVGAPVQQLSRADFAASDAFDSSDSDDEVVTGSMVDPGIPERRLLTLALQNADGRSAFRLTITPPPKPSQFN